MRLGGWWKGCVTQGQEAVSQWSRQTRRVPPAVVTRTATAHRGQRAPHPCRPTAGGAGSELLASPAAPQAPSSVPLLSPPWAQLCPPPVQSLGPRSRAFRGGGGGGGLILGGAQLVGPLCHPYPGNLCQVCVHVLVADLHHLSDPLVVAVGGGGVTQGGPRGAGTGTVSGGGGAVAPGRWTRSYPRAPPPDHRPAPPGGPAGWGLRVGSQALASLGGGGDSLLHHLLIGGDLLGVE